MAKLWYRLNIVKHLFLRQFRKIQTPFTATLAYTLFIQYTVGRPAAIFWLFIHVGLIVTFFAKSWYESEEYIHNNQDK